MTVKKTTLREGRWITVDLHVHSIHSGGVLTPRGILEAAQRRFLDAVAVTDHDEGPHSYQGALDARELSLAEESFPVGLVGREISGGDHFHFLLLQNGANAAAPVAVDRRHLVERIACHQQQGGIAILAHPWTIHRNQWAKCCVADLLQANLLDGIELFNAAILSMAPDAQRTEAVLQEIREEWVMPYQLGITGGSDYHRSGNREIGTGRTYLKVYRGGETGILEALKARRCVAGLISDTAIPFSGAQGETKIFWGGEPWLTELQQLIRTITRCLPGCFGGHHAKNLVAALLAGGHYQIAMDLLWDRY